MAADFRYISAVAIGRRHCRLVVDFDGGAHGAVVVDPLGVGDGHADTAVGGLSAEIGNAALAQALVFIIDDGMELIEVLNYTIDGVPMIYCGNELCDEATINMFANRFYMGKFEITDRSDAKKNEPAVLRRLAVMRALNTLKATSEILRDGETVWIDNTEPEKVLSFMRVVGSGKIVTVGNISSDPVTVKLSGVDLNNGYKVILESEARAEIKGDTLVIPSHGYIVAEL